MRKFIPVLVVLLLTASPSSAFAAIAFDSALTATTQNVTTSTNTISFTNTAGNLVIVGVVRRDTGDVVTSVSYGGSAMTLVDKQGPIGGSGSGTYQYVYYLNSPATGANNIVVTSGSTGSDVKVAAVSYSGAATNSTVKNASNKNTGSAATSLTGTITPTVSNTWGVMFTYNNSGTFSAGSGSTARGTLSDPQFFDSNGVITSGASYSMGASWTGSTTFGWITLAIAPPAAATTNFEQWAFSFF
jgi:hypothetical protein